MQFVFAANRDRIVNLVRLHRLPVSMQAPWFNSAIGEADSVRVGLQFVDEEAVVLFANTHHRLLSSLSHGVSADVLITLGLIFLQGCGSQA